ncbi:MAG TPA: exosortase/archaeosortase family protein [Terriglobia bacterium]|nr:exosortase/archaeosortase family protein [Terriglobia bacterium]
MGAGIQVAVEDVARRANGTGSRKINLALLTAFLGATVFAFAGFWAATARVWFHEEAYSYGILVPAVSAYLLWRRRRELIALQNAPWTPGLVLVVLGCALRAMGERGDILCVSGAGFILVLIGAVGFLWGRARARIVAMPLAFLIFMVPLPSYALATVSWQLQTGATAFSADLLRRLGILVFQDGNFLVLPGYTLAVKEACSGTRYVFALLALAGVLGLSARCHWILRLVLLALAPVIALLLNVIRIVGTGFAASLWGAQAAQGLLHATWAIVLFLLGTALLVGARNLLQWLASKSVSPSY